MMGRFVHFTLYNKVSLVFAIRSRSCIFLSHLLMIRQSDLEYVDTMSSQLFYGKVLAL